MCSRLFKGNEEYTLQAGDIIPCVGPKGVGRARFEGFARSERLGDLWRNGIPVDLHWTGFGERKPGTDYWLPEGMVVAAIGIPSTHGIRILTKATEDALMPIIKHHRQPVMREPIYPLDEAGHQRLAELEER